MPNTSAVADPWISPAQTAFQRKDWLVVWMLAKREWIRFFRQPFRVIAALGQPILFWLLFGTGMHSSFRGETPTEDFMAFFLPGIAAMILLFTAIFTSITIIEDRREGFLQSVLVSDAPRWTIACGKIVGGAAIAWVQALVFLSLAWITGQWTLSESALWLVLFMGALAVAMASLGFCIAWPLDSTQEFHAVMNMVLLPMWLLSGGFFPIPALNGDEPIGQIGMHWVMRCNPMTYAVSGMRHLMADVQATERYWSPSIGVCIAVTFVFTAISIVCAILLVERGQKGELA
jgi:ABC-2 type transport system permease protein